jgi:Transposase
MPEMRRRYDPEFHDGAVHVVRETGKSIRQVAEDLGVNPGTLANWVIRDKIARAYWRHRAGRSIARWTPLICRGTARVVTRFLCVRGFDRRAGSSRAQGFQRQPRKHVPELYLALLCD